MVWWVTHEFLQTQQNMGEMEMDIKILIISFILELVRPTFYVDGDRNSLLHAQFISLSYLDEAGDNK